MQDLSAILQLHRRTLVSMNTPEQGYRRTRIATAAIAALGITVFGGTATLAYLDTHEPESTATVADTVDSDDAATAPTFGSAPRVTTPGTTSGSGATHARTQGS
ncbi:hypothetical protein CH291_07920 [Rhodococcus sp. 14-1411-2a]|nr:hypothetical protein CH291_07920 [Rhodococcus sp. 14-1411-2a]